jgi:hypothetical protein
MHEMRHDIGEKHSREETGNVVIPVHNGFSFRLAVLERFWQLLAFMNDQQHVRICMEIEPLTVGNNEANSSSRSNFVQKYFAETTHPSNQN